MKGRISKIGSYAISSSIRDQHQQPCISCTTFNILAPIYKRLSHKVPLHHQFLEFEFCVFFLRILILFWKCRIKVFVKVIIERIGLEGIIESLIGYCMRDLQSYVYRCSTKFLCEDFLFLCFFGYVF
jgi:hypothetical protein